MYFKHKIDCRITGSILLLTLSLYSLAQSPRTVPSAYSSTAPVNYVRTWNASSPQTDANAMMTKPLRDVKQITQYFDGLGRPLQTVVKQGSYPTNGTAVDMISMTEYDEYGREQFKYLPTPANSTGGNASISDGLFKLNPFAQQAAFYNQSSSSSPLYNQGETFFYSQIKYEASPLNRIQESFAPGNTWAGTSAQAVEANRRSVKAKYYANTATDAVRIWKVTNGTPLPAFGTYASATTYAAGQLYKNITVDENNKQVIEFKDKGGKVILKKVQLTATADDGTGRNHDDWLCTYYIYDDLGQLRCVIQPEGVKSLSNPATFNWNLAYSSGILLNEQCFRYEYDARNRMIVKKVPGAGEVYMVYDTRDRLVMTQDASLRAINKWMVTLYDNLNRPVQTGLLLNTFTTPARTFVQHLGFATPNPPVATFTPYPFDPTTPPSVSYWEYQTKTGYDIYTTIPGTSGLNNSFDGSWSAHFNGTYNTSPLYAQQQIASLQTKGMVTWTETKVLGTTTYLYTVNIYDEKGRAIQVKSKNVTGGVDINSIQYSWAGQPLITVQKQEKVGTPAQTNVIVTQMTYDDLGRVIKTEKKLSNTLVNSNAMSAYKTIAEHEYDALGQLKKKKIGNKPGAPVGTSLAKLDFDYNIRGWLLSVNKDYVTNSTNSDQYFGMQLGYDKNGSLGTFAPQYNGNIGGMLWKSEGDQQKRKYDFTYDAINRLTKGNFTQYVSGTGGAAIFNVSAGIDFSIGGDPLTGGTMKYDANGNIMEMWQTGLKLNTSVVVDKLAYTYNTNSNRLLKVFDNVTPTTDNGKLGDFKDGSNGTGNDYTYDVNGNLTTDNNKAISSITYNHLNLPLVITVTGKGNITYRYDAAGNKQKKVTTETGATVPYNGTNYTAVTITTTTTYLGGAVFETKTYSNAALSSLQYTDKLQFIGHEEGRMRGLYDNTTSPHTLTGFAYDYMLKDHLGNVRTLLTEEQKTLYYPAATLEGTYSASNPQANSMINHEKQFYNIDNTKVFAETTIASWPTETVANTKLYYNHNDIPPASPNPNYPAGVAPTPATGSTKLYKFNATSNKTGLEFIIKVMAGDKIDIFGKSYFLNTGTVNNANSTLLDLATLMTNLLTAPANGIGAKGVTAAQLNTWNTGLVPSSFFRGQNGETTTIPKAYINYIFLDEQFKYTGGNFSRVGSSGIVKNHWNVDAAQLQNITVPKNGYIFVYVSNESNLDVFFDNLQVVHKPGPILEETHYYPFGLTMAGISSKALTFGQPENKKKYNGYEYNTTFDINLYETFYRSHDPQIGRFWQIDPKPNVSFSGYAAMANNPILFSDRLGDTAIITLPNVTVTNSKKVNANFGIALANLIANRSGINSIEKLLQGTGVRLAEGQIMRSFLGPAAGIASLPFTLSSDNMSAPNRRRLADADLNEMLMKGDLEGVIAYVENWNGQRRNQHDRIVFRYMSTGEFDNRLQPDDDLAQALPFDGKGNYGVKYITPDIYVTSSSAKSSLALPSSPDIAIWTYESQIMQTKMPAGAGQYQTVKGTVNGPGGGREATILQPFPIHGFFPLINK